MNGALEPGGSVTVAFAVLGAFGVGLRLVGPRATRTPALLALLVGQLGVVASLAPREVRSHALPALVAALVLLAVAAALAGLVDRRPVLLLGAIAATVPLRVPVQVGGDTANLLLPLHGVLGLGLLGLLRRELPLGRRARAARAAVPEPAPPRRQGWLPRADVSVPQARTLADIAVTAVTFIWCASLSWTLDGRTGTVHAGLFILPFATGYLLACDALDRLALRGAGAVQRGLVRAGTAFVAVLVAAAVAGLWQATTDSIFHDPDVSGRYLVAALLALGARALFAPRLSRRAGAASAAVALLLAVALWHTHSQGSFLELVAGAVVLATFVPERRGRRIAVVLALAVVAVAAPLAVHDGVFHDAGRLDAAQAGARLAAEDPATGLGIGSFSAAYAQVIDLRGGQVPRRRESYLAPVTIAVEQGIYGLCAYVLFLLALAVGAIEARRGAQPAPGPWIGTRWAAALAAGLVVHSMLSASWFEDPIVWLVAALLVTRPDRSSLTQDR